MMTALIGAVCLLGDLFPFVMDAVPAEGVADVSALLAAPAGRDGFVRRVGEHFETDAGRIRFNGMNLTGAANFPRREQAVRLATGLARRGVNCVRLHYMDADYGNFMQPKERGFCEPDGTFRPELLDRLDFLVSEFKRRGIYVDLNLQVMRLGKKKAATMFDADVIADQKAFAKRMLEHVNPYTKLAWRDDPAVAFIELSNEDGVTPNYARSSDRKQEEFARHCMGLEKNYLKEMRRYLREELGVKVPISSSCIPFLSPYALTDGDFVDYHDYWCHPDPINDRWTCMDEPLVNVTATDWFSPTIAAGQRPAGHPFTISEYGHPYPSTYGAEGQPMMRALGAFQDWDAVFTYSWANRENVEPNHVEYFFSVSSRPDVLAHMPAAAAMFLRGDVKTCRSWIDVPLSEKDYFDGYYTKNRSWSKSADVQQASGAKVRFEHGLVHGLRLDITGKAPMPSEQPRPGLRIVSDTEEIVWDRTVEDGGYGIVDTPNVKFFTGFPKGRAFDLHGVRLEVGKTQLGWATVSILSHGANGFGENGPARILLAATGICRNTDAKLTVSEVGKDGMRRIATRGEDWGKGPVLCEGIPLKVTFGNAGRVRCWALDPAGNRRTELAVDGNQVVTSEDDRTVWYEIEVVGAGGIAVDDRMPGGNVRVVSIDQEKGVVNLMPDARADNVWFFTHFRVRGAEGRTVLFLYERGKDVERLTKVGPAVSRDGGKTWRFLNAEKADASPDEFTYAFGPDEKDVRFATSIPYVEANWNAFVGPLKANPHVKLGTLCKSQGGKRENEVLRILPEDPEKAGWTFVFTCRHHACECSASWVVEGLVQEALADTPEGRWMRANAEVVVVPFVDKDGVEEGDQGKSRKPHDPNQDYLIGRYNSVRAIREIVLEAGKRRRVFFMDNHAPWIRNQEHDHFYSLGAKTGVQEDRWNAWRDEFEKAQANAALKYERKWDIVWGSPWNSVGEKYRKNGWRMSHAWVMDQPGVYTAFCNEIGYGLCGGVFSEEGAREIGRNMVKAMVRSISRGVR